MALFLIGARLYGGKEKGANIDIGGTIYFEDGRAQKCLIDELGKKAGRFNSCKKSELIKVMLESDVDHAGVVADEIMVEKYPYLQPTTSSISTNMMCLEVTPFFIQSPSFGYVFKFCDQYLIDMQVRFVYRCKIFNESPRRKQRGILMDQ